MDWFLARGGYWVAWAAVASSAVLRGDGEDRSLGSGLLLLLGTVAWPCALRGAALRGDRARGGLTPPRWPALVRRSTVRLRWPLAAAYGAFAAWYTQWHHDVPWLTVVAGLAGAVAVAYAARPLPAEAASPN